MLTKDDLTAMSPIEREISFADLPGDTLLTREAAAFMTGLKPRALEMRTYRKQPPECRHLGRLAVYTVEAIREYLYGKPKGERKVKPRKSVSSSSVVDDGFERFWKAYPKKRGKAEAKKAWAKLPSGVSVDAICGHLEARIKTDWDWIKDGGQFIPNPSTFLNQHRFEDEWKPFDGKTNTERFNELTGDQWVKAKEEGNAIF